MWGRRTWLSSDIPNWKKFQWRFHTLKMDFFALIFFSCEFYLLLYSHLKNPSYKSYLRIIMSYDQCLCSKVKEFIGQWTSFIVPWFLLLWTFQATSPPRKPRPVFKSRYYRTSFHHLGQLPFWLLFSTSPSGLSFYYLLGQSPHFLSLSAKMTHRPSRFPVPMDQYWSKWLRHLKMKIPNLLPSGLV